MIEEDRVCRSQSSLGGRSGWVTNEMTESTSPGAKSGWGVLLFTHQDTVIGIFCIISFGLFTLSFPCFLILLPHLFSNV